MGEYMGENKPENRLSEKVSYLFEYQINEI